MVMAKNGTIHIPGRPGVVQPPHGSGEGEHGSGESDQPPDEGDETYENHVQDDCRNGNCSPEPPELRPARPALEVGQVVETGFDRLPGNP